MNRSFHRWLLTVLAPLCFVASSVAQSPHIDVIPTNQIISAGNTAIFAVEASGTQPLAYQWWFNSTRISGATNSVLVFTNATCTNGGHYRVWVTNSAGSTYWDANLTVMELHVYAVLKVGGSFFLTNHVEYTTDLNSTNWTTLTNIYAPDYLPTSPVEIIDRSSQGSPQRFYRVRIDPPVLL